MILIIYSLMTGMPMVLVKFTRRPPAAQQLTSRIEEEAEEEEEEQQQQQQDPAAIPSEPAVHAMASPVPVIHLGGSSEDEEEEGGEEDDVVVVHEEAEEDVHVAPLRVVREPAAAGAVVGASTARRPAVVPVRVGRRRRRGASPAPPEPAPTPSPVYAPAPLPRQTQNPTPAVVPFPPLVRGPCIDPALFPRNPNPGHLDLDGACFMMLTSDLPGLLGIVARPAYRKVKVRDLPEFGDWLHVISDPVVVRVFAGSDAAQRDDFRARLVARLRSDFGLTLTLSTDSCTVSQNRVDASVSAMSRLLDSMGARICRVSFFGMKSQIQDVEPVLDRFIASYHAEMGSSVPVRKNVFHYGARLPTDELLFLRFGDAQERARRYTDGTVREMCEQEPHYGSVHFGLGLDGRTMARVKIYQELCHEDVSVVQKRMLHHHHHEMPRSGIGSSTTTTTTTVRTGRAELRDLFEKWRARTPGDMLHSRLTGIRIEIAVQTERVIDGRRLCSEYDLFQLGGIERALGAPFEYRSVSVDRFMGSGPKPSTLNPGEA